MLVALLVGAIRSTAELNSEPEFMLRALNRRLMGRGDAQATCLALRISLKEGDSMVLLSGGFVEAQDANGKLFVFERVHRLLHTASSAAQAAQAAQQFGQEYDIGVIAVTRTSALETAYT